jgi:alpha-glucosidase (family GH31 glycosyl hydrolase)
VARMEEEKKVWWESLKERDHLEDQGVDGMRMDRREIGWGGGGVDSVGSQ